LLLQQELIPKRAAPTNCAGFKVERVAIVVPVSRCRKRAGPTNSLAEAIGAAWQLPAYQSRVISIGRFKIERGAIMTRSTSNNPASINRQPIPAGGVASPPIDPHPASPSPLMGQQETNSTPKPELDSDFAYDSAFARDPNLAAAFEFGWQSCLQQERSTARERLPFEKAEPELGRSWQMKQPGGKEGLPWEKAREAARDAWTRVQDAMFDSEPKPSAR
jgi:hypothetical protein